MHFVSDKIESDLFVGLSAFARLLAPDGNIRSKIGLMGDELRDKNPRVYRSLLFVKF